MMRTLFLGATCSICLSCASLQKSSATAEDIRAIELSPGSQVHLMSPEVAAALDEIRGERLHAHLLFLADDLLEGRGTGSRGYQIAARYVAAQFKGIGLEPLADRYLHPIAIRGARVDATRTTLELKRQNGSVARFTYERDFVVAPDLLEQESSLEAEVVFAGYCISAPEFRHDDFKDIDLRGKLVACMRGAPLSFPAQAQVRYSSFEPRFTALAARGAVGMVDLRTPRSNEQFPWAAIVRGFRGTWMDWLERDGRPARHRQPIRGSIVLGDDALTELFRNAPFTFAEAITQTDDGSLRPFKLGVTLSLRRTMTHTNLSSPNVVGFLRGSDSVLRHQYVVYTAHLDHLGIREPVNGDSIYNGASDNASGIAALIEVARSFTALPQPPRRSILFVAVTGEEAGVVGSDHFVHNPPVRLDRIVANVNIDGIAAIHPALADVVAITQDTALHEVVQRAAQRVGLEASPDPAPERLYALIGDQFSFSEAGIPAVWTITGNKSSNPSIDVAAFKRRWGSTIYHTPADDVSQSWNWTSAVQFTRVQFLIGYIIANTSAGPSSN